MELKIVCCESCSNAAGDKMSSHLFNISISDLLMLLSPPEADPLLVEIFWTLDVIMIELIG